MLDILFKSQKMQRIFNNQKLLVREFGAIRAKVIRQRLDDLRACNALMDMRECSGKFHQLTGNRSGQFAVSVDATYRLVFECANEPVPRLEDGGFDLKSITAVRILEVVDYHD
jgi:proteic killer suppression protein